MASSRNQFDWQSWQLAEEPGPMTVAARVSRLAGRNPNFQRQIAKAFSFLDTGIVENLATL
jgi:hypothetical protein